jgi:hypothetical protein
MVKAISPNDFAERSEPLPRKCDSYSIRGHSIRGRLFFKSLRRAIGTVTMRSMKQTLILIVVATTVLAARPLETFADQLTQETAEAAQSASETPADLQQLVAPIALYPDALVAQILAASTYPTQIVQADRWLQGRVNLPPEQIAAAVDKESWDPSVKALTAFPSVLANLDQNLSWTTALGEAYFSQPQDVLDSVQVMRRRAEDAGSLSSTPQQTVVTQGPRIVIEPVQPDVCYLPVYDPWLVYGPPIVAYPGYFQPLNNPVPLLESVATPGAQRCNPRGRRCLKTKKTRRLPMSRHPPSRRLQLRDAAPNESAAGFYCW